MFLEELWVVWIYIGIGILSLYTVLCFFDTRFLMKKIKLHEKVLIYASYVVVNGFLIFGVHTAIVNTMIQIFMLWVISNLFRGDIKSKVVIIALYMCMMIAVEFTVGYAILYVFHMNLEHINAVPSFSLLGMTIARTVSLMLVKFIQFCFPKNKDMKFSILEVMYLMAIPVCGVGVLYLLNFLSLELSSEKMNFIAIASFLIIAMMIIFYILLDKVSRMEQTKYETALLKEQASYYIDKQKNLEENYNAIIKIKHNLNHKLLYAKEKIGNISDENFALLEKEIDDIIGETLTINVDTYTKNVAINTILSYKLYTLEKNNIPIDIKVNVGESLILDEKIIYVLLGNLFDNVVENYNSTKSQQKKVKIRIYEENENLYIKFSNPYAYDIKFKDGIPLTRKRDKENHGIGIQSMQELLLENHGSLRITAKEYMFTSEIILFRS